MWPYTHGKCPIHSIIAHKLLLVAHKLALIVYKLPLIAHI